MAERDDVVFSLGETWELTGVVRDLDAVAIALPVGAVVRVAVGELLDEEATIDDAEAGTWSLDVTPEMQAAAEVAAGVYPYEVRAYIAPGQVSTQTLGDLTVLESLFAEAT